MMFWEGAFGIVPEYFDFVEQRSNKEKNETNIVPNIALSAIFCHWLLSIFKNIFPKKI